MSIFRAIDVGRLGTENAHIVVRKFEREIVGYLSAGGDDDGLRLLELDDIKHALERELIKIKPVRHIVVGRHRFGIRINHDRAIALALE